MGHPGESRRQTCLPTFRWCLDEQVVFPAVWAEEVQDTLSFVGEVAYVLHTL